MTLSTILSVVDFRPGHIWHNCLDCKYWFVDGEAPNGPLGLLRANSWRITHPPSHLNIVPMWICIYIYIGGGWSVVTPMFSMIYLLRHILCQIVPFSTLSETSSFSYSTCSTRQFQVFLPIIPQVDISLHHTEAIALHNSRELASLSTSWFTS